MLENLRFKSTNGSGSIAAAYLIFFTALIGATLFTGLAFWQQPHIPVIVYSIGASFAVMSLVLRFRPDLPSQCLHVLIRGHRRPEASYEPRLVKAPRPTNFGTNRPPSVQDIREIKEAHPNWVPSRVRSKSSSRRQR